MKINSLYSGDFPKQIQKKSTFCYLFQLSVRFSRLILSPVFPRLLSNLPLVLVFDCFLLFGLPNCWLNLSSDSCCISCHLKLMSSNIHEAEKYWGKIYLRLWRFQHHRFILYTDYLNYIHIIYVTYILYNVDCYHHVVLSTTQCWHTTWIYETLHHCTQAKQ